MGLEYVDIFYSHRFDPGTPLEETMGALDAAVRQGKALYVGISSYSGRRTAEAAAILRWVGDELGTGCYVNLMAQYYVAGKVGQDSQYLEIARGIHREEYEQALALAEKLGLRLDARSVGDARALARAS